MSNVMGVGGSVMDVGGLFGREADRTKNVVGREERKMVPAFQYEVDVEDQRRAVVGRG